MTGPPPYPRIPHLVPGRGSRDDRVLSPEERHRFLAAEVSVEEKLDGANVGLWADDGLVQMALRARVG